jgi:hypothetical protein
MDERDLFLIGDIPGFTPQIGRLVSMMNYASTKDRLFWVWLSRIWSKWRAPLLIVTVTSDEQLDEVIENTSRTEFW